MSCSLYIRVFYFSGVCCVGTSDGDVYFMYQRRCIRVFASSITYVDRPSTLAQDRPSTLAHQSHDVESLCCFGSDGIVRGGHGRVTVLKVLMNHDGQGVVLNCEEWTEIELGKVWVITK